MPSEKKPVEPIALSDSFLEELAVVLSAQARLVETVSVRLDEAEAALSQTGENRRDILELERDLAEIEASADLLCDGDVDDFEAIEIESLYAEIDARFESTSCRWQYRSWRTFVNEAAAQNVSAEGTIAPPLEALLSDEDLEQLRNSDYDAQFRWDPWDYGVVGVAGVLAALTDFLLVKIPQDIAVGEFAGQTGSPITAWLKQYNTSDKEQQDWFAQFARWCEKTCKTPYDGFRSADGKPFPGMSPHTHRFQTLGHAPILGLIFGIIDLCRGTITGFKYDIGSGTHTPFIGRPAANGERVGVFTAFLKQVGHMLSDVCTPSGLPAPLMQLFQFLNVGEIEINGEKRTLAKLARWMDYNGFDLRHFLTSSISVAVVELVVRGYAMIRYFLKHGEVEFPGAGDPKLRSMLLTAHGIACLGNAGKIVLYQGNPLAINLAEWMALSKYAVSHTKYVLFERHRLRMEHLERLTAAEWDRLEENMRSISAVVCDQSAELIELGTEQQ
ncbi:hypothetical protein [Persicimonas caeni]|uniref:hypothetical protein n=1 Tax=Persicimonas caeni TaxID=2292766 RepID=UPI00143D9C97|nr:hypothetical protein [Persicimonas caeni]